MIKLLKKKIKIPKKLSKLVKIKLKLKLAKIYLKKIKKSLQKLCKFKMKSEQKINNTKTLKYNNNLQMNNFRKIKN